MILTSLSSEELKAIIREVLTEIMNPADGISPSGSEPELMTVKEAAKFTGLAVTTLYEKTSKRTIPHFKKGKRLYFRRTELEEWIVTGRVKTQEELEAEAAEHLFKMRKAS